MAVRLLLLFAGHVPPSPDGAWCRRRPASHQRGAQASTPRRTAMIATLADAHPPLPPPPVACMTAGVPAPPSAAIRDTQMSSASGGPVRCSDRVTGPSVIGLFESDPGSPRGDPTSGPQAGANARPPGPRLPPPCGPDVVASRGRERGGKGCVALAFNMDGDKARKQGESARGCNRGRQQSRSQPEGPSVERQVQSDRGGAPAGALRAAPAGCGLACAANMPWAWAGEGGGAASAAWALVWDHKLVASEGTHTG
jgi:hypothetical protein